VVVEVVVFVEVVKDGRRDVVYEVNVVVAVFV
jgi:hypothetical protein